MIILIRHAEPRETGKTDKDVPLSNIGFIQAYETGRYLAENVLSQLNGKINMYCSPMVRAIQTVQVLHSTIRYMVEYIEIENCLKERDAGLFTNVNEDSRLQLFPSQTAFFNYRKNHDKFHTSMSEGELPYDLSLRLTPFIDLCNKYLDNDQHCIIVAHAKTILILKKKFCQYDLIWYNQLKSEPKHASIHGLSRSCMNYNNTIVEQASHTDQISTSNRCHEDMITDTIVFEPSYPRSCDTSESIQSNCLFHFRKKIWLLERIFFGSYFGNESLEVRQWAYIARKGIADVENSLDLQFECAAKWLNYMIKDDEKLINNLMNTIRRSQFKQFKTITITYPVGLYGTSKNVLPLVFA